MSDGSAIARMNLELVKASFDHASGAAATTTKEAIDASFENDFSKAVLN